MFYRSRYSSQIFRYDDIHFHDCGNACYRCEYHFLQLLGQFSQNINFTFFFFSLLFLCYQTHSKFCILNYSHPLFRVFIPRYSKEKKKKMTQTILHQKLPPSLDGMWMSARAIAPTFHTLYPITTLPSPTILFVSICFAFYATFCCCCFAVPASHQFSFLALHSYFQRKSSIDRSDSKTEKEKEEENVTQTHT